MKDLRIGYLYSLAPIHSGGQGDLGNTLDIAREVHTNFPYIPGSSLRGSLRDEINNINSRLADTLFGKELDSEGQMGVHQVWFGDTRLLWVPMRTMSFNGSKDIFTWVSCHSLIRDYAILTGADFVSFPNHPVGSQPGEYTVADAKIQVSKITPEQEKTLAFTGDFPPALAKTVKPVWSENHLILPDTDFQILLEHALWTQIRNKIEENTGSAGVFWTDICIPRDTILYYCWGYNLLTNNLSQGDKIIQTPATTREHQQLIDILTGLIQVGGQANVGRGWAHSWISNDSFPSTTISSQPVAATV